MANSVFRSFGNQFLSIDCVVFVGDIKPTNTLFLIWHRKTNIHINLIFFLNKWWRNQAIRDCLRSFCPWILYNEDGIKCENMRLIVTKPYHYLLHCMWSIFEHIGPYAHTPIFWCLERLIFLFICGTLLTPPVFNNYTQTPDRCCCCKATKIQCATPDAKRSICIRAAMHRYTILFFM